MSQAGEAGRELPEPLAGWIRAQLGAATARWAGWAHAESEVWRVEAGARLIYCKRYRSRRKYTAERAALERWAPALPGTPRVLAILEGEAEGGPALLLTAVPGVLVAELELARAQLCAIHERAGAWLAALHGLAWDDRDPVPLGRAWRLRADSWLARARGIVDDELRDWVRAQAEELAALDGEARVPCHRDFSPRNWLWDGEALGVIDFEHARADWWLHDLDKLDGAWWRGDEELRAAFFAGYGRTPSAAQRRLAAAAAAVNALSTITWAATHGDASFEREGRARLLELRAGASSAPRGSLQ